MREGGRCKILIQFSEHRIVKIWPLVVLVSKRLADDFPNAPCLLRN